MPGPAIFFELYLDLLTIVNVLSLGGGYEVDNILHEETGIGEADEEEEDVSSTEEDVSSTGEDVSSTEKNVTSTEEDASSTEEDASSTEEDGSSTKENFSSTEEVDEERNVSPEDDDPFGSEPLKRQSRELRPRSCEQLLQLSADLQSGVYTLYTRDGKAYKTACRMVSHVVTLLAVFHVQKYDCKAYDHVD